MIMVKKKTGTYQHQCFIQSLKEPVHLTNNFEEGNHKVQIVESVQFTIQILYKTLLLVEIVMIEVHGVSMNKTNEWMEAAEFII